MSKPHTPRVTLALIAANGLSAAAASQFMFVLPWMLLARGHSPTFAALATACVYVPMLLFAVPAGMTSDRTDPRRVMLVALTLTLAASALYPLATLGGIDTFVLVLVAGAVTGALRNFMEGALMRGMADTTAGAGLLRAHAIRTTVVQTAVFGSPFVGLLLFHAGGAAAVLAGVCALLAVALAIVAVIPAGALVAGARVATPLRNVTAGFASLRGNPRLQAIGWANLTWNVFAGAAIGIMPAVLREHIGLNEVQASVTFAVGALAVVALTLPLVRLVQQRVGAILTFLLAVGAQGLAVLLFADGGVAILAPLLYALFLLSNSAAASSLNGARALEVDQDHQALVNLALSTIGLIGFIVGLVAAAGLLGPLGFGALLVLIAAGLASTAVGFRRPLVAA